MKEQSLTLILLCFALPFCCFAQTINVRSADGSIDTIFNSRNDLQKAIDFAPEGSTIILGSGVYPLNVPTASSTSPHIALSKEIHIIGAGIYPDSTKYTGRTILSGHIYLLKGADNCSIEGLELYYFNGWGDITSLLQQGEYLKNLIINKVKFRTFYVVNSSCTGIAIKNSFFSTASFNYSTNIQVLNNIIVNQAYGVHKATIENNIFMGSGTNQPLCLVTSSLIKNNIFRYSIDCSLNFGNLEYNNAVTSTWITSNTNYGSGNISNIVLEDVFVNFNQANADLSKIHLLDLHIKSGSVVKGAGTDGKDLGIYGGVGFRAVPSIPYIDYKDIGKQTNAQGQLPVNIRVKAQGNN